MEPSLADSTKRTSFHISETSTHTQLNMHNFALSIFFTYKMNVHTQRLLSI